VLDGFAVLDASLVMAGLLVLVGAVAWRPHGWGPAGGALVAVLLAALGGSVAMQDLVTALRSQWRAYVMLGSVMTMTTAAERLGLLERLASKIEPRTRGPVKHAFRVTFAIAALVAAVFSNDAAVLLLTPTILMLLRTVYPRRHPKFLAPFSFAVFAAAGVAPLVVSNPMNLIVADHVGIDFNRYAIVMVPVALASWAATYALLAWTFREVLADDAPALGAWPHRLEPMSAASIVVLVAAGCTLLAYPVMSSLELPLWPVAALGALVCAGAALGAGQSVRALARGIAWPIFPFLTGVFLVAIALERIGVVGRLHHLYLASAHPIATVGVVSAVGSALLNNHPMSVLNVFALEGLPAREVQAFAALIGGDLGPRVLPVGSLAALLWYDVLRKHAVDIGVGTFVRIGAILTVPTLAVSLALLAVVHPLASTSASTPAAVDGAHRPSLRSP
jgi:arsenical pump membrane protein